ncbi:MAG TPA: ABC transporter substrate-binding protein [Stellaceae bacterium]|nr:ABC transporter substrate-binding protein [Stellaceae bacterium]
MKMLRIAPASAGRLASLGLLLLVFAQTAAALPAAPQTRVQRFYTTLLNTMKAGPQLGSGGRYAKLAPVVARTFDVPFMARLAVGPAWSTLSPSQQQQVSAAFQRYISATYADRFDNYSGEQLQVLGQAPYGSGVIVETRIVKSSGKPVTINYMMRQGAQGAWQISDVYLDGTISQLATQRSEFHSILQRSGVDGLIATLNRKTDLLTSKTGNSSS